MKTEVQTELYIILSIIIYNINKLCKLRWYKWLIRKSVHHTHN